MRRFFPESIKWQLFLIVFAVGFPAVCVILYSGLQSRNDAIKEALKDTQKLVDMIASEHQHLVVGAEQLMTALAELPEVKNRDQAGVIPVLQKLKLLNPMYSNIFIADPKGLVWASAVPTKPPFIIADRRYFKNAIATGQLSSGEYVVSRATTKPAFNLAYPVKDANGSVTGVISVGFIIDKYRQLLERLSMPPGTSFVLIDHRGIILSRAIDPEPYIGKPYTPDAFKNILAGPVSATSIRKGITGDMRIISYRKLTLPGEQTPYMYVTAGIPEDVALGEANRILVKSMAMLLSFLGAAFVLSWYLGKRSITDPIGLLINASQRLANGNLRTRISNHITGGELGSLAESFDTMVEKLTESDRLRERNELMLREQNRQLEEEMGERQKAEERLLANERFLQTIIETEPECIKMVDIEGNLLMMNRAGLDMIDAESFEQVKGQNVIPMVTPEYRSAFLQLAVNAFAGKSGSLQFEAVGLKGRHVWLESYAVPYRNEFGEITASLSITRDITGIKMADQEKLKLEDQLNQSQKLESIGRLAGGVAHDFNNLLTPILGYAELVKYKLPIDSPEVRKMDNILQAADKARILTQQLLSFGRKQVLEMSVVNMNEV
ncbi:MAG: cache domain-containing protein, partial [Deltaproteobacteria bacterium]